MILSRNITCDTSFMFVLTQETIKLASIVVNEINEEDSGLFVQINDQNNPHAALALPNSACIQGADADESLEAFRDWLIAGARNFNAGNQVSEDSDVSLAFHHLTQGEAINITNGQWQQKRWNIEIQDNGFEKFASVFWMAGTGLRRATFTITPNIFG